MDLTSRHIYKYGFIIAELPFFLLIPALGVAQQAQVGKQVGTSKAATAFTTLFKKTSTTSETDKERKKEAGKKRKRNKSDKGSQRNTRLTFFC